MKKRSLLAVILILGVVFLTRNNVAWADAIDVDSPVAILAEGQPSLSQAGIPKGSVVPTPTTSGIICSPGVYPIGDDVPDVYPIGGAAVLNVDELAPGYCVEANITIVQQQNKMGKLPEGGQAFLSKIVLFRVYKQDLVDKVPLDDANMSLCFALPPDKEGEIYFYDYYGADFFGRKENPGWVVNGTVDNDGTVCTSAMATGAYVAILAEGQPNLPQAGISKGSVVPPPTTSRIICSPNDAPGIYPIGGVAVLYVDELAPGYCVEANITIVQQQNKTGKLPEGGQAFLSKIVLFRVYKQGLVDKVPLDDANMSLCFALPPDKEGEIYFYDYYGADFFGRKENPGWVVNGTVDNDGIVCTSAMATGAYVLIEQ